MLQWHKKFLDVCILGSMDIDTDTGHGHCTNTEHDNFSQKEDTDTVGHGNH